MNPSNVTWTGIIIFYATGFASGDAQEIIASVVHLVMVAADGAVQQGATMMYLVGMTLIFTGLSAQYIEMREGERRGS